jgi:hypothetical protein
MSCGGNHEDLAVHIIHHRVSEPFHDVEQWEEK